MGWMLQSHVGQLFDVPHNLLKSFAHTSLVFGFGEDPGNEIPEQRKHQWSSGNSLQERYARKENVVREQRLW
jgi:hypothetical protein